MEANRTRTRWTYAEFARLPSEGSERQEIIDGELHVTPSPSSAHQRVVTRLVASLHAFVRENALGEVFAGPIDVILEEGDYMTPDVVFVRTERPSLVTDRGVEGPPDLVVEVASPSTAERDRGVKLGRYRLYAVSKFWVVDPGARTIEVWDLAAGAEEPVVIGGGRGRAALDAGIRDGDARDRRGRVVRVRTWRMIILTSRIVRIMMFSCVPPSRSTTMWPPASSPR